MLKTVNGYKTMTGTSPESPGYIVTFWHKNGMMIGLQIHIKMLYGGKLGYSLYARAQRFDDEGNDMDPTLQQMAEVTKRIPLQLKSDRHASGNIFGAMIDVNELKADDPQEVGEAVGDFHRHVVSRIAKATGMQKMNDDDLRELGRLAYFKEVGFDPAAQPKALSQPSLEEELAKLDELDSQADSLPALDIKKLLGSSDKTD